MKYKVEIIETLARIVSIDAMSEEDACAEAKRRYRNGEVVLSDSDYSDTEIKVFES